MRVITKSDALDLFKLKRVNLVTGSFDLIHAGHIDFLKQAKSYMPEIPLLVIVLSDNNIKARKGMHRPIFSLEERLIILSALKYIDYLLPWDDPWEEIREFVTRIDLNILFVNKKDPGIKNKEETANKYGFKIIELKQYNDLSTTAIIERITKYAKESK